MDNKLIHDEFKEAYNNFNNELSIIDQISFKVYSFSSKKIIGTQLLNIKLTNIFLIMIIGSYQIS